jgi:hypothetical protein
MAEKTSEQPDRSASAGGGPRGVSLHLGLNAVDPDHYGGWDGQLAGCENDANDMEALAASRGFTTSTMLTTAATAETASAAIAAAAEALAAGDIFLLTYSGHGGQVPDTNGDEGDHQDETWVLHDRELVDDELWALYGRFARGVRIVVLSDSCHSGTVTRELHYRETYLPHTAAIGAAGDATADQLRTKCLPKEVEERTYAAHRELYDGIQRSLPPGGGNKGDIGADVLLISGCADNQTSGDGPRNGVFTGNLLRVWQHGAFKGSYRELFQKLSPLMPSSQSPNYYRVGTVDEAFDRQAAFTI